MRTLKYALAGLLLLCCSRMSAQEDTAHFQQGLLFVKTVDTMPVGLDTTGVDNIPFRNLCRKHHLRQYYKPCEKLSQKLDHVYVFEITDTLATDSMAHELEDLPYIEYAEKVPMFHIFYAPNDFSPTAQYALNLVDAPRAWDVTHGSKSVVLAIVDDAIRTTHEDIMPNVWVNTKEIGGNGIDDDLDGYVDDMNGYDVADNDNSSMPPSGITDTSSWIHGSHCSGIAAASTDNGRGIASIGFNTSVMAVKCTPNNGNGSSLPHAFDGVVYAMRAGADIISMSFGTTENSRTVELLMNEAYEAGIVLVAAAGNENTSTPSYPAAYENVIAVAATDASDRRASFSNYGSWVDVAAPGVGIRSVLAGSNSSYGLLSGTSMATPMVAGLAGLVLAKYPNATPAQVKSYIQKGCKNIDALNPGYAGKLGAGRINAANTFGVSAIAQQKNSAEAFSVYPNPMHASGTLQLALSAQVNVNSAVVSVFNAEGQVVYLGPLHASNEGFYIIPTATLRPGTYWVRLTDNKVSGTQALIVL